MEKHKKGTYNNSKNKSFSKYSERLGQYFFKSKTCIV